MVPLSPLSKSNSILEFSLKIGAMLLLLVLSQACLAQKSKKNISVGPGGGEIEIAPLEFRETMNDFFFKFERTITESADSIIRVSTNPAIDKEAMIWKMNSIPVANTSIYNSDPFLGYIDVAVFTYQLKMYFGNGAGRDLFGEHQSIAVQTMDLLWEDLKEIGRNIVPDNDISEGTKVVMDFAEQHPITSSYFVRQSTIPLMAKIQAAEKVTLKGIAVDMSQSMNELRSQISSYMEVLPKQVRWEAEFLLNNMVNNPDLTSRLDSLSNLLERSVIVLESSPELIDNQREAAFEGISGERIAVLQAIRQEREIVLEEIKKERAIILEELNQTINIQREATFRDLTALTNQTIEMSFAHMDSMVDKLYWRTVIMIAALTVIILIGLIIYKKI